MAKRLFHIIFIFLHLIASFVVAADDGVALLKKIDQLYRSDTSIASMKMQIITPNWQRTLEMQSWTRGMDDTFIRVLSPRKDRGVATLKKDKEMWNYFPKINKVIKVPPSMMMGSWMGSDFTNDDLVREVSLVEEYHVDKATDGDNFRLTLKPKQNTVTVWGKIEIVVNQQSLLPLEQSYFNEKGEKVRIMTFSEIREFSGKKMPAIMTMQPLNKSGHKTVIEYVDAQFDVELDKNVFTLRNLQKRF
ncbi:outer membrane lipoprotein-sorting protein [Litorilituus sediminis]|uniref:Outer membrane lipoprotein-sorting protein n=1 Tax=Litorilituus sediminis TaxID=718192 RepID=A0A4P6P492_9GAMM|nr:outer membrane lipoprotein-sorting protein [Litorilituus sediminis]QBG36311.1 outer membrane lipoprotein-sorting protein [Litorilituus sediminis]